MQNKKRWGSLCLALILVSGAAQATDGFFSSGFGMKANGRGGASLAWTTDAFGGANNPATMVWVGSRMDVGVQAFVPIRGASRTGSSGQLLQGPVNQSALGQGLAQVVAGLLNTDGGRDFNQQSDKHWFPIPEFAYNHMWGRDAGFRHQSGG
jgi:hypothetical protein